MEDKTTLAIPDFKYLLRNNIFTMLVMIIGYVCSYLMNVFLARHLHAAAYGDISVVLNTIAFSVPFALLGTELSTLQFMPNYILEKNWKKFKGYWQWSNRVVCYTFASCIVLGIIIIWIAWKLDQLGIKRFDEYHPAIYSFWLIPLGAYIYLQSALLNSFRKYTTSIGILSVGFPLLVIILLTAVSVWQPTFNIYLVLGGIGGGYFIVILLQRLAIRWVIPVKLKNFQAEYSSKLWFDSSLAMMKGSIVYVGLVNINIIILEWLGSIERQVGEYAAIVVIVGLLSIANASMNVVLIPLINVFHNKKDQFQKIINSANKIKIIPVCLVYLVILFFGKQLLSHFGEGYVNAYIPLVIIATSNFFWSLFGFSSALLFYSVHPHENIRTAFIQFCLIIILDICLIPYLQLLGTALAVAIPQVIAACLNVYKVHKYLGLKVFWLV